VKKFLVIILSISLILCLSGCFFEGVSLFYSDIAEVDGFCVGINETSNCCFVGGYNCTEYTENLEITIPDDYQGMPIKRIGGYYGRGVPTPFSISLADLYMNAPEDSDYNAVFSGDIKEFEISEKYTVEDVIFNLNIGKNIEVIDFVVMDEYYPHINEDGSIVFYHSVVNINCSNENKHFYSKDGKLYNKKTDELISDFAYVASK
jgi:hypothetical protein